MHKLWDNFVPLSCPTEINFEVHLKNTVLLEAVLGRQAREAVTFAVSCAGLPQLTQRDSTQIFQDAFVVLNTSLASLSHKFVQKSLHCIPEEMKYSHLQGREQQ